MKIKSRLPVNVHECDVHLFKNKEEYSLKPIGVKPLRNVFVTQLGSVIHRLFLPGKSAENLRGSYDETFYWKHWRKAIEQFVVSKYGKSLKSITLKDDHSYFTIHTPWFGYFSWLTTCLPRLITVLEKYPDAVLIMPEEWKKVSYVMDSLALFPDLKTEIIPNDHHIFVKKFLLAETRPWTSYFYPEQVNSVRNLFFNHIKGIQIDIVPIKKIYVSRKKANRRKLTNEAELEAYLLQQGFQTICFEDYSILEQIYLMQHAEILISMHGAGLANTLFLQPGSKLLELTPKLEDPKLFRFPFWRIASILEVEYYVQFCASIDRGESDFYSRDLHVDREEFSIIVKKIIKSTPKTTNY